MNLKDFQTMNSAASILDLVQPGYLGPSFKCYLSRSRLWFYDQDVHLLLYVKLIEADHILVPKELTAKFTPAWLSGIVFWDEFNVHRKVFKPLRDIELDPSYDCVLYGNTGIRQGGQLVFRIHPFVTRRDTICIISDKNRIVPESVDRYTTLIRSGRYRTMRFISMKSLLT